MQNIFTTVTEKEIITDEEDVSVGAAAYADTKDLDGRSAISVIAVLIISAAAAIYFIRQSPTK